MLIGYGRVSTTGLSLSVQHEQLRKAGCEKIYEEKLTGADRKRPQLIKMLRELKQDDTLIITNLDRLARSTHDLLEITKKLKEQQTQFRSLREPWADTTSPMGSFLLTVFAGLFELKRSLIRDRTEEGRVLAKNEVLSLAENLNSPTINKARFGKCLTMTFPFDQSHAILTWVLLQ